MSTKTFDQTLALAPTSESAGAHWKVLGWLRTAFIAFDRAMEASALVDRGVAPREAYQRVYKTELSRD